MTKEHNATLNSSKQKWIATGVQFKTPEPIYKPLTSQVSVHSEWFNSCIAASNALIDGLVYLDEVSEA